MVNIAGIVSLVKFSSLKHRLPCNLSVVLETYTENPKNLAVYPLFLSGSSKI